MNTNGAAGLGRRTLSKITELRLSYVAFEIKSKVWSSKEKSEMLVAQVRGVGNITRGQCLEKD